MRQADRRRWARPLGRHRAILAVLNKRRLGVDRRPELPHEEQPGQDVAGGGSGTRAAGPEETAKVEERP